MKTKKLKRLIAMAVMSVACLTCGVICQLSKVQPAIADSLTLSETVADGTYKLGSSYRLEDKKATIGDTEVTATARKIVFPDNSAYATKEVTLSVAGQYKVEYAAVHNGKTYLSYETFCVYDSLYSVSSLSDSASYGANVYAPEYSGLNVTLMQGSTFTFNPIIDFTDKTANDLLISFNIQPKKLDVFDFKKIYIVLTDIHDESNYVSIRVKQSGDPGADGTGYIAAMASCHSEHAGTHDGIKGNQIFMNPFHGFASCFSFNGQGYKQNTPYSPEGLYQTRLYFDYENREIYAKRSVFGESNDYVINLETDFNEAWQGFTTGEARLSIYADDYIDNVASFIIDSIYDYHLTETENVVEESTPIMVELPEEIPTALVGYKYPLFNEKVYERYGLEKIDKAVYFNYYSSTRYMVECSENYFVPTREGTYTIVYICTDRFGNKSTVLVDVQATKVGSDIELTLGNYSDKVQGTVAVSQPVADYTVSGGYGELKVDISVQDENGNVVCHAKDGAFKLLKPGSYHVVYTATDYVGQSATKSYDVTIGVGTKAIFDVQPNLPKYLIKGEKYILPDVIAKDYTSGSEKTIKATVTCEGGTLEDNALYPTAASATITYTATSSAGYPESISYVIPVVDVSTSSGIDMSKYFVGSSVMAKATNNNVDLVLIGAKGETTFINGLLVDNFLLRFYATAGKTAIKALTVKLTDSVDASQSVTFRFENDNGTQLIMSGATPRKIATMDLTSSSITTDIKYDGRLRIGSLAIPIPSYDNGKEFEGFASSVVYLTIGLEGTANAAGISVENISGQPLYNGNTDDIAPMVSILGPYGGRHVKNAVITLPKAICKDVLSPTATVTMTVESPSGFVTAGDGTLLRNADPSKDYSITLEENGMYMVTYTMTDGAGNESEMLYFITVKDCEPPVISVSGGDTSGKVGSAFAIGTATATDDITTKCTISVFVYVNGSYHKVENGGTYTAMQKGTYKVIYMAMDKEGNAAIEQRVVTVH